MKQSLDESTGEAHDQNMNQSEDADYPYWDFPVRDEAMTTTVDPGSFYAEQAALAALLAWVEAKHEMNACLGRRVSVSNGKTLRALDRLYEAGVAVREAHAAQEQM